MARAFIETALDVRLRRGMFSKVFRFLFVDGAAVPGILVPILKLDSFWRRDRQQFQRSWSHRPRRGQHLHRVQTRR
jgi:hypothetical protein